MLGASVVVVVDVVVVVVVVVGSVHPTQNLKKYIVFVSARNGMRDEISLPEQEELHCNVIGLKTAVSGHLYEIILFKDIRHKYTKMSTDF